MRERSSMVEYQLPKLVTGVRFPSLAPAYAYILFVIAAMLAGCATAPEIYVDTKPDAYTALPSKTTFRSPEKKELFTWPVKGSVISYFGSKVGKVINKGIDIKAAEGSSVRAAKSGRVVYCDPHLKGFGKTVILSHGDKIQTVYSYNSDIMVRVGDAVEQNMVIAKVGRTGRAKEPSLHFEVRRDGVPQNPVYYLKR